MYMAMGGVGGPLLCIGDLLSDIGEDGRNCDSDITSPTGGDLKCPYFKESNPNFNPSNLPKLFLENYEKLKDGLAGTDYSWTALTLETANKLVDSTHCDVGMLSESVQTLEKKIDLRDSNVASAKAIQSCLRGKWSS